MLDINKKNARRVDHRARKTAATSAGKLSVATMRPAPAVTGLLADGWAPLPAVLLPLVGPAAAAGEEALPAPAGAPPAGAALEEAGALVTVVKMVLVLSVAPTAFPGQFSPPGHAAPTTTAGAVGLAAASVVGLAAPADVVFASASATGQTVV